MKNLKYYVIGAIVLALLGLGFTINQQAKKIKRLNSELVVAANNNKAYESERDSLKDNVLQFQFTIDQLNYSKDSLINRINNIRKEIKVKDKKISELQYLTSVSEKHDSIFIRDTIFKEGAVLDTTIKDDWSKLTLHAEYPNIVDAKYSFKNETLVVMHDSRVTVDPPKKCWLVRLFQKKQTVVEVEVLQQNPYCINKDQKFIKIIK